MLSNLETEKSKLLQIVLVGQPNLRDKLASPELEQLRQRITVSYHLTPLDQDEAANYINHRLRRAALGTPLEFPREATDVIHARSRGVPRIMNVICDAALVFGYAEERRQVDLAADQRGPHRARDYWGSAGPRRRTRAVGGAGSAVAADAQRSHWRAAIGCRRRRRGARVAVPRRSGVVVAPSVVMDTRRAADEAAARRLAVVEQREQALRQRERELADQRRVLAEEYRLLHAQRAGATAPPPAATVRVSGAAPACAGAIRVGASRRFLELAETAHAGRVAPRGRGELVLLRGEPMTALAASLLDRIQSRRARTGVVGLGYVGLPLAVELAKAGFHTTGIDLDERKIEAIEQSRSYIPDVATADVVALRKAGKLDATTDFSVVQELDTINICVPTPLRKTKDPDMSYIVSAVEAIAKHLHPGMLIVLESTTYPGTTDEVVQPILEATGLKAGQDFFIAFSPERVDPGNPTFQTHNVPEGGRRADAGLLASSPPRSTARRSRRSSR